MATPLYRRLSDALRAEINRGVYGPGDALPSERELGERFNASRGTVRQGLQTLVAEGLIIAFQGRAYQVREHEEFVLDASRHENLQFSTQADGDSYSNDVLHAGRHPHQTMRIEIQDTPADIAERLRLEPGEKTVLRFCSRFVDDTPWSTQATHYPAWLLDKAPRIAEPPTVEEGTTRYLASLGIDQVGYRDELRTRMPAPEEARQLDIGPGVPVLVWTRTGYTTERPVRCTTTIFRGDLNRITYDLGNLQAFYGEDQPR